MKSMKSACAVLHVCFWVLLSVQAFGQTTDQKIPVRFQNSPEVNSPPSYSHAVTVTGGKIIFISGQVGLNKEGQMVGPNDFRAQTAQAFANLKAVLAAAGARPEHLIKLTYFVVRLDKEKLTAVREVRDQFINKANPPASTLVGAQALFRDDCQIELEAVAVIP